MKTISIILLLLLAIIHFYIVYLEMFLWATKKGIKIFGLKSKEFAEETKVLAANQGFYNGILAVGLLFCVYLNNIEFSLFFCIAILFAGIFGFFSTKNKSILFVQSIPSLITILSIIL